jgi:hypothetical protein
MKTVQLAIGLPDTITGNVSWLKTFLAAKLYESRELSPGQAAAAAGMPERAFVESPGM